MAKLIRPTTDRPCPSWCDLRADHPWTQGPRLTAHREHTRSMVYDTVRISQTERVDQGAHQWDIPTAGPRGQWLHDPDAEAPEDLNEVLADAMLFLLRLVAEHEATR